MTLEAAATSVGLSLGVVEAAIFVIEIEEVLVARIACCGAMLTSWEKIDALRSGTSGTASIMKSADERSSIFVDGSNLERASEASGWESRDLDTSLSSSLSFVRLYISNNTVCLAGSIGQTCKL